MAGQTMTCSLKAIKTFILTFELHLCSKLRSEEREKPVSAVSQNKNVGLKRAMSKGSQTFQARDYPCKKFRLIVKFLTFF